MTAAALKMLLVTILRSTLSLTMVALHLIDLVVVGVTLNSLASDQCMFEVKYSNTLAMLYMDICPQSCKDNSSAFTEYFALLQMSAWLKEGLQVRPIRHQSQVYAHCEAV